MYPVGKSNALQNFLIAFGQSLAQQKTLQEERAREDAQRKEALAVQEAGNLLPFIRDDLAAIDSTMALTLGDESEEGKKLAEDAGAYRKGLFDILALPAGERAAAFRQLQQDMLPRIQQQAGVIQNKLKLKEEKRQQSAANFAQLKDVIMRTVTNPNVIMKIGMAETNEDILALGNDLSEAANQEVFRRMSPVSQWSWASSNKWLDDKGEKTAAAPGWLGDIELAGARAGAEEWRLTRVSSLQNSLLTNLGNLGVEYENDPVIRAAQAGDATPEQVIAGINRANALKVGASQNSETQQFVGQIANIFSSQGLEIPKDLLEQALDPKNRTAILIEASNTVAKKVQGDKDAARAEGIVNAWRGLLGDFLDQGLPANTQAKLNDFLNERDPLKALDKLTTLQTDADYQKFLQDTGQYNKLTKGLALEQQRQQLDLGKLQITQLKQDQIAKYAPTTDPAWFDKPEAIKHMKSLGFTDGQISSLKLQAKWGRQGSPQAQAARTNITMAFQAPPPKTKGEALKIAETLKAIANTGGLDPDFVSELYMSYWSDAEHTRGIEDKTLAANLAKIYSGIYQSNLTGTPIVDTLGNLRKVQADLNTQINNVETALKRNLSGQLKLDEESYKGDPEGLAQLREYNRLRGESKKVGDRILELQGFTTSQPETGGSQKSVDDWLKKATSNQALVNALVKAIKENNFNNNATFTANFDRFLRETGLSKEEGAAYLRGLVK